MASTLRLAASSLALLPALAAQDQPATPPPTPDDAPRMEISLPSIDKLTVRGQYRIRYENRLNYDFDSDVSDPNDFFTQRLRLDIGLQLNEQISAFMQLQDVRNWGQEQSTTAASAPGFDFHQGWVQIADFPGIGGADRIGRQVLSYGNQRLIGALEGLSQGRAFDGIRHSWEEKGDYRIDAFATQTYENTSTLNVHDDAYFAGGYGSWNFCEDGLLDFYLLYLYGQQSGPTSPDERRATLGARWQQQFGVLDAEVEAATQFGEVSGADIPFGETYALHASLTASLGEESDFYLGGAFDAASGDDDPTSSDNARFNNLFPTAHMHLGMADLALWENILAGALKGGFKFAKKSKVEVAWWYFRAMEAADRFGGPNGIVSPGVPGGSKDMGNEIDLFCHWDLGTKHVATALELGYALFLPGSGAKGADDPAHFIYVQGDFRF